MIPDTVANAAVVAVVGVPILGALLCWLVAARRSRVAAGISVLASVLALAAAITVLVRVLGEGAWSVSTLPAPALGPVRMPLELQTQPWTAVVAVTLALVGLAAQAFLRWYLWTDPRYPNAAAGAGLLIGATQLVVLSGDVVLTLVGWELGAVATALLVLHDPDRADARRAAARGWLMTRAGDVPFAVGLLALAGGAGSTASRDIEAFWSRAGETDTATFVLASLGIVLGVLVRGAQLPFVGWLRDTAPVPLPAAAVVQGAGSVVAALVVLTVWGPLLLRSGLSSALVITVSIVSVVVAGVCALAATDLRTVLNWVTVGHVSVLLLAVAVVPATQLPGIVATLLAAHAVVITLAFLVAAWSTVLVGSTVTARLSGAVRRHPRLSRWFGVTTWSLAAAPPTIAFIGAQTLSWTVADQAAVGRTVATLGYAVMALAAVLGAGVAMRVWLIVQHRTVFERRSFDTVIQDSYDVADVGIVELLTHAPQVDESGHMVSRRPEVVDTEPRPTGLSRLGLLLLALAAIGGGALVVLPGMTPEKLTPNWLLSAAVVLLMAAAGLSVRIASLRTVYGDSAERLPRSWRSAADRHLGTSRFEDRLAVLATAPAAWARAGHEFLGSRTGATRAADEADLRGRRLVRTWADAGPLVMIAGVLVAGVCVVALW